jgi:hypothetical protein
MTAAEPVAAPRSRICRTVAEAFRAGWDDGVRLGERLPAHLLDRLVALHSPYLVAASQADVPAA